MKSIKAARVIAAALALLTLCGLCGCGGPVADSVGGKTRGAGRRRRAFGGADAVDRIHHSFRRGVFHERSVVGSARRGKRIRTLRAEMRRHRFSDADRGGHMYGRGRACRRWQDTDRG